MIIAIPSHLAAGRCSPKKRNIHNAVKTGRILLYAFACVTPTSRKPKQKRMKAMMDAKIVRYATQPKAICISEL